MKICPQCSREYDNSMMFCLDDGAELLYGPELGDEPATAILHTTDAIGDGATQAHILTTHKSSVRPSAAGDDTNVKGFDKRLVAAPLLLAIVAVAGFLGYRYLRGPNSGPISSIAVLPFENAGGTADSEYLSDGLAESLIYRLSQIPELKVSPRSSVFRYKGKGIDPEQVGSELGVDAVMSGRMVQRGESLTISVDLVDVRNKKTLWGEQFERKMSDLLATQREIASAITEKLQLKLTGEAAKGAAKRYTDNNDAYQAYLKGRYYWNRRTAENLKKAIEQLKTATDRDPNFALAYAGLADCYAILPEYAGTPTGDNLPQAKSFAERAIAIDDGLAEAHASLAQIYTLSWQWAESEQEFKRAIELNPNYATTYHWYSHLLRNLGRYDEAALIIKRGHELDPLSSIISANVAEVYRLQNNPQACIDMALKIIELDPNFSYAYNNLGLSYSSLGRHSEAVANMEKSTELSNRASFSLMSLGYVYAAAGKRAEATAVATELEERYARKETPGIFIAGVYAGLADKDKAFHWLEKDFQEKGEIGFVRWRVHFESLRDDPRYMDLLKRMGLL
jgi:adenylate cyclase